MRVETITVHYEELANLGDYSNVRPQVTLQIALDPGDDMTAAYAWAWQQARDQVQAQIDQTLEQNDRSPKYTTDPLYDVLAYTPSKNTWAGAQVGPAVFAVVPTDTQIAGMVNYKNNHRLPSAIRYAQEWLDRFTRSNVDMHAQLHIADVYGPEGAGPVIVEIETIMRGIVEQNEAAQQAAMQARSVPRYSGPIDEADEDDEADEADEADED